MTIIIPTPAAAINRQSRRSRPSMVILRLQRQWDSTELADLRASAAPLRVTGTNTESALCRLRSETEDTLCYDFLDSATEHDLVQGHSVLSAEPEEYELTETCHIAIFATSPNVSAGLVAYRKTGDAGYYAIGARKVYSAVAPKISQPIERRG